MSKYFQVFISAESLKQADDILGTLLTKKLTAGGIITHGPAKFWWKGHVVKMEYYNISAFTIEKHKQQIITQAKIVSIEEVPMIWFVSFEGNEELLHWIDQAVG